MNKPEMKRSHQYQHSAQYKGYDLKKLCCYAFCGQGPEELRPEFTKIYQDKKHKIN